MGEYLKVLAFAALPAIGNFAGGSWPRSSRCPEKRGGLLSDGTMVGTGSAVAVSLGLLLALAQVPADIPEGFATIATFQEQGVPRGKRLLLAASFALPIFLGATIGYWALRDGSEVLKMAMLAFTAGILISIVVEEMVQEAHRGGKLRIL
jgi:zinc transporter, ZIP family